MICGEGLVEDFPEIQPKDIRTTNLEVRSKEGNLGFRSPSRGPLAEESLFDPSF